MAVLQRQPFFSVDHTFELPAEPTTFRPWHRWQDWLNLIVGLWLWICPGIFNAYGAISPAESGVTTIIAGTIICGVSLWSLAEPETVELEVILLLAGIWLALTPAMFGFTVSDPYQALNHWATGTIAIVLSLWALMDRAAALEEQAAEEAYYSVPPTERRLAS